MFLVLFLKRTTHLEKYRRTKVSGMFFLKKEPKTLALRGFNSLSLSKGSETYPCYTALDAVFSMDLIKS
jgi:hypothetical protein